MNAAQITTFTPTNVIAGREYIALAIDAPRDADLDVYAASDRRSATLYIRSAHEAREIAQHLVGVLAEIVTWAEAQERATVPA